MPDKYKRCKNRIKSFYKKYANQMTNSRKLSKQVRTDKMKQILEIPPQDTPIPIEVLKYAEDAGVTIREISGKALEEFERAKHLFY